MADLLAKGTVPPTWPDYLKVVSGGQARPTASRPVLTKDGPPRNGRSVEGKMSPSSRYETGVPDAWGAAGNRRKQLRIPHTPQES